MLKLTVTHLKGEKFEKPITVFIKIKANVDTENDRLICAFSQGRDKEKEEQFDWAGLVRSSVIKESPELPKKSNELPIMAEALVKEWITGLKLSHITSIESV